MVQAADVSDSSVVDGMVAAVVDRFGQLDVIVNNAGVHEGGDPASITDEKWRKVMSTDVDGVFYGCRAALPHLEKTKGSIVNTASVPGTVAIGA
jgi:meso-butanediol dehydrogenase/(S,S)-butanediol dehydrogenase/diacetyl reductase